MSPALPTGTVTFLFTDIEGSTRLLESHPDSYRAILERHHALMREAVGAAGGVEVTTEGDAFFVVFTSAPRAAEAAVAAQRALVAEPWPGEVTVRVRMGLHTGEGMLGGDSYIGLDVHRAARIAAAGHGGQVLLSGTTTALTAGSLPEGVSLRDLGQHRLKDLSAPEQIGELVIEGLAADFDPIRTLNTTPNNLPTQLTSFLGRDQELSELTVLLEHTRLLTLTGPGGTGKTRLALQVAADASERYPDGTWFVPLSAIGESGLVLPTVAQVVGLPPGGGPTLDRLADHLAGKKVLIVLDNFEQVVDAGPELNDLLTRTAATSCLVTSRAALRLSGEQEYSVPPLPAPDLGGPGHSTRLSPADLMAYPSVALFAERAMAVRSGFALNDDNAAAVVEICVRLDGLPLAIELAAARVKLLTPQAILARLGDRLALLAGGARDLPARQQTLRGAIDWSHDLLDETDQRLFARMSVFSGGASLEAVERVVPDPTDAVAIDPVNGLSSLVDKSLIRQGEAADGEPRFSTLETIREYGTERLAERGETRSTRDRHAAYYLDLFEAAAGRMLGPDQRTALDLFDRENDNLRTALAHAGETADALTALRLVAASWRFWQMRGFLIEGMDRARHALAIPGGDTDPAVRLKALDALGGLEYWHGDFGDAMTSYQGALALAEQLGDPSATAQQYYNLSFVHFGDPEAILRAKDYAMRARDLFREIGDRGGEGRALWGLVNTTYYEKDLAQSEIWIEEALAIFRESDDQFMLAWALYMRGNIGALLGDRAQVRADLREALQIFVATDDLSGYALLLDAFAVLDYVEGNSQRAMTLAGAASAIQDWSGVSQLARLNRQWEGFFLEDLLKDPELATAFEAGRQLSAGDAVALALTAESSGKDADAPVYRAKLAPDPD